MPNCRMYHQFGEIRSSPMADLALKKIDIEGMKWVAKVSNCKDVIFVKQAVCTSYNY